MRDILFRGKTGNGKWIYGDLVHIPRLCNVSKIYERDGGILDVFTATLGQFTGLLDKHGAKIFEGDIVKLDIMGAGDEDYLVIWHVCAFKFKSTKTKYEPYDYSIHEDAPQISKIIGNIHDNPELLEVRHGN